MGVWPPGRARSPAASGRVFSEPSWGVGKRELLEEEGGQCGGSLDNIMNFTGLFFFFETSEVLKPY